VSPIGRSSPAPGPAVGPPDSARRERALRSHAVAAAPTRGWWGRHPPGARMRLGCSPHHGSHGGKPARGIAPGAFRLRTASACFNGVRRPNLPPCRGRLSWSASHGYRAGSPRDWTTWKWAGGVAEHVGPPRNAASAGRQVEKCAAGAPSRGGADSPPRFGSPGRPPDCAPARAQPGPERRSPGHRRRRIFPRVRPRRDGPICFAARTR